MRSHSSSAFSPSVGITRALHAGACRNKKGHIATVVCHIRAICCLKAIAICIRTIRFLDKAEFGSMCGIAWCNLQHCSTRCCGSKSNHYEGCGSRWAIQRRPTSSRKHVRCSLWSCRLRLSAAVLATHPRIKILVPGGLGGKMLREVVTQGLRCSGNAPSPPVAGRSPESTLSFMLAHVRDIDGVRRGCCMTFADVLSGLQDVKF